MSIYVVLGCSLVYNKKQEKYKCGEQLKNRCKKAAIEFYKDKEEEKYIICCGGKSYKNENTIAREAEIMKRYMKEKMWIDENRIYEENESMNTIQNIYFTSLILQKMSPTFFPKNVYIVSTFYHIPRCEKIASHFLSSYSVSYISAPFDFSNNSLQSIFSKEKYCIDILPYQIKDFGKIPDSNVTKNDNSIIFQRESINSFNIAHSP